MLLQAALVLSLITGTSGNAHEFRPSTPVRLLWGNQGHMIVCEIAWAQLDPEARDLVARLRQGSSFGTFAESCIWADKVRTTTHKYTAGYHFINPWNDEAGINIETDCAEPTRCVPWAIRHYAERLADQTLSRPGRAEALMFLGHFVGDLHQPLHAGRPGDRGGNRVQVDLLGDVGTDSDPLNLHKVWDTSLLARAGIRWPEGAHALAGEITSAEVEQWSTFDVVGWAKESHALAKGLGYDRTIPPPRSDEEFVGPDGGPGPAALVVRRLDENYAADAFRESRTRLRQAGVRLAFLINRAAARNLEFPAF